MDNDTTSYHRSGGTFKLHLKLAQFHHKETLTININTDTSSVSVNGLLPNFFISEQFFHYKFDMQFTCGNLKSYNSKLTLLKISVY